MMWLESKCIHGIHRIHTQKNEGHVNFTTQNFVKREAQRNGWFRWFGGAGQR